MNSKIVAAVAVFCFIAVMASPVVAEDTGASAPDADYAFQLDSNGRTVFDEVSGRFATELSGSPSGTLSFMIYLKGPVLFATPEEATAYAEDAVQSALAAIYYTDAEAIWLWDLPVSAPEVSVQCGEAEISYPGTDREPGAESIPVSVSFSVTVPSDFADSPDTAQNEISQAVSALREAAAEVKVGGSSTPDKVVSIAGALGSVKAVDDAEAVEATEDQEGSPATVSNAYDALVTGESSSAGVAMAFTYLCGINGVTAATVAGTVVTDSEGATERGYWNVVWDGERWYAADVTVYDGDDRSPLMAGMSTLVPVSGGVLRGFGSTHVADPDLAAPNSLAAVQVPAEGYEWPDDRTFLEKYGTHVMAAVIVAVIVAVILYALRNGDL